MKKILLLKLIILSSFANAQIFRSYEVPFNPDRFQALALGYDAVEKKDIGVECINKEIHDLDQTTNLGSKMSSTLVTNHHDLLKTMDISMNMSADMSFAELFSGNASFSAHYNKTFHLKQDEISFVLYLSQDYGRQAIINPVLKPEYQNLLKNKDYDTFRTLCGTHYYSLRQNKAYVVAMIKISGLSKETKKMLETTYSSSLKMDAFNISASMSASFKQMINEVKQMAKVSIEFFSVGGSGIVQLTDTISNSTNKDINEIVKSLTQYARSMTADNAAPAKFKLNLYPGYPIQTTRLSIRDKNLLNHLVENSKESMLFIQSLEQDKGEVYDQYSLPMINILFHQIEQNENAALTCLAKGECDLSRPDKVDVITKANSLKDPKLKVQCEYKKFIDTEYLTRLHTTLEARLFFPQRVKRMDVFVKQNGKLVKLNLPYNLNIHLASENYDNYLGANMWYKNLYASLKSIEFNPNIRGISDDISSRAKVLKELKDQQFWIKLHFDGSSALVKLGYLDMTSCPITR
jgi:hypothetical protein